MDLSKSGEILLFGPFRPTFGKRRTVLKFRDHNDFRLVIEHRKLRQRESGIRLYMKFRVQSHAGLVGKKSDGIESAVRQVIQLEKERGHFVLSVRLEH